MLKCDHITLEYEGRYIPFLNLTLRDLSQSVASYEKRSFLILVWVFLQEEGDQGKRELKRVLFCRFQSPGTSYLRYIFDPSSVLVLNFRVRVF